MSFFGQWARRETESRHSDVDAADEHADATRTRARSGAGWPALALGDRAGTPISPALRAELEPAFGEDIGGVRVHTDPEAGAAAEGIGAAAFTHGQDVAFAPGRYEPETPSGRALLAHEVAHTIQHDRHGVDDSATPAAEREATGAAASAVAGAPVGPLSAAAPAVARAPAEAAPADIAPPPPGEEPRARIRRLLGTADVHAIVQLAGQKTAEDRAALEATTPVERAGLIRVLIDLYWTREREEAAIVWLMRWGGAHVQVIAHLDVLGYRQKVLDSVDDESLHREADALFLDADKSKGAPVSTAPGGPGGDVDVRRVLDAPKATADDIRTLPFSALQRASHADKLRMLQVMLDLNWSNAAEEGRTIDILEASGAGLKALLDDVTALGLKQRLFDHIDEEANKRRFVALLRPLNDPTLNEDLRVFQRGFWEGVGEGTSAAWDKITSSFTLDKVWEIVRGLARPIVHPLDSMRDLIDEGDQVLQDPSLFRAITFLRDLVGFAAVWFLVASGVVGFIGGFLVGLLVTSPLGLALLAGAAVLLVVAGIAGALFVALSILRLWLDQAQAGAATTSVEARQTETRLAEDIQLVGVIGALHGVGKLIDAIKGAVATPESTTPEQIRTGADEGSNAADKLETESDAASKAADQPKVANGKSAPAVDLQGTGAGRGAASGEGQPVIRVPAGRGGGGRSSGGGGLQMQGAGEVAVPMGDPLPKPEPMLDPPVEDGAVKLPGVKNGVSKFPGVSVGDGEGKIELPGAGDGRPRIDPGTPSKPPIGDEPTSPWQTPSRQVASPKPKTDVPSGPQKPVSPEPAEPEVEKPPAPEAQKPKPKPTPKPTLTPLPQQPASPQAIPPKAPSPQPGPKPPVEDIEAFVNRIQDHDFGGYRDDLIAYSRAFKGRTASLEEQDKWIRARFAGRERVEISKFKGWLRESSDRINWESQEGKTGVKRPAGFDTPVGDRDLDLVGQGTGVTEYLETKYSNVRINKSDMNALLDPKNRTAEDLVKYVRERYGENKDIPRPFIEIVKDAYLIQHRGLDITWKVNSGPENFRAALERWGIKYFSYQ